MRFSRTSIAGLAAVALLAAACSSSASTPGSQASQAASTPTSEVAASAAPQLPPAPTNFTATEKAGSVPCPSADGSCSQADFAWQSSADPGTGFRIYRARFGLDPNGTCPGAQADAEPVLDAKAAARTAQLIEPLAVGGGKGCYWITAVNDSGESAQVAAAGN